MTRRLALLALSTILTFTGVVSCPQRTMACPMVRQAAHECCKHTTNLSSAECCCGSAHQASAQAIRATPQDHQMAVNCTAIALDSLVSPTASTSCAWCLSHGPAPPDTPITQHTLLLL